MITIKLSCINREENTQATSSLKSTKVMNRSGFTLIEILVVLFIIGITAGIAIFSIHQRQGKQLENFTRELTQLVKLAEEQAILQPATLGVHFTHHAFQFAKFQPTYDLTTTQPNATWLPLNDNLLKTHAIPQGIEVALEINHLHADRQKHIPQIVISANGNMTPFTIFVSRKGNKPRYAITGNSDGSITNETLTS